MEMIKEKEYKYPAHFTDVDIVRSILPFVYTVKETKGGVNCESNTIGISDEYWDQVMSDLVEVFGERFEEVFHQVCGGHMQFTVFLEGRGKTYEERVDSGEIRD